MNLIGNILWIIFGGFLVFLEYVLGGMVLCVTIVGIPFGLQCFKIGVASLAPFGLKIKDNSTSSGCLTTVMNILWIFCGGLWLAITHLFLGLIFCITIIGIPFGRQHFKLMGICLTPFGKRLE